MIRPNFKPIYMKLYEELRHQISSGAYSYGRKIPSKRELAQEKGCSVITVEHAYDLLIEEGYIEARNKSGYYVVFRKDDTYSPKEIETQSISSNYDEEQFPYSVFAKAVRKVLTTYDESVLTKVEGQGAYVLRDAIASYLNRSRAMEVTPEQIIIGSGSEYLYSLIVEIFGRDVIYGIEKPSYSNIQNIYHSFGVKTDSLKLGKNGILSKELKRTNAKILHVTPFYSYPSGSTTDVSKRMEYIEFAKKKKGIIVEDDYASEFSLLSKPAQTLFSLEPNNHVLYLNTFTKTISPSIRVSYMVLPKNKTSSYLKKIAYHSTTVSTLLQYVLAELLNNGSLERHINRIRRKERNKEE